MSEEETTHNPCCPECGSSKTRKFGKSLRSKPFRELQRYQCVSCGRSFIEKEEQTIE